jgi:uncharacterized protein involved in exopolysaccharide biosynthesis
MNQNEIVQDDEISLFDLWEKLRSGWRYVVGGTAFGLVGAGVSIAVLPPKYEAVAVVQVGQVGQVGQMGQVGQVKISSQPVEPPAQAIERMKTPAFQRRVAESLGDQQWMDEVSHLGATKDIILQVIKATVGVEQVPLIEMRVSGVSPNDAQKKTEAAIAQLITNHGELAKSALARMRSDLAITREKLTSAERDLETLNKLVTTASVKDDRFTQLALMTSLRIQKESETFNQRQMIMALETALETPATQPAKAIEDVFISDKPVSPKKALLLVLGLVGGLLVGIVSVFFVDALRRAKERR